MKAFVDQDGCIGCGCLSLKTCALYNREDRAKLNHYEKQILKILCHIQFQELIHQDHMSGTADREPFCDSLYDPKENDL